MDDSRRSSRKEKKKVAVTRCHSYEEGEVKKALQEILAGYGGMGNFVSQGSRVLIKPNMLAPAKVDEAVTTHPAVVKALIELVREAGGKAFVGDSVMTGPFYKVAGMSEIKEAADQTGATLLPLTKRKDVSPGKNAYICHSFAVSAEAMGMDLIINAAKLKTHTLTGITAAVKNCYGLITGMHKRYYHVRYPLVSDFGHMLLDLYLAVQPALSIVDAVVAMEGLGPRSGRPRPVGALLASTDAVALDAACAQLAGYSLPEVSVLDAAVKRGYLKKDLSDLEITGPLAELALKDFDKGASGRGWSFIWRYMPAQLREARERRRPWPVITGSCTRCQTCLEHCPVECIHTDGGKDGIDFYIDYDSCIRCYCCNEVCPYGAVRLRRR